MLPTPYCATMGASTTAIAPVGPDTWTCEPPKTAATTPGDHRGHETGGGTHARADAERQRQRERDDTDGDPGEHVASPGPGRPGVVAALGSRRSSRCPDARIIPDGPGAAGPPGRPSAAGSPPGCRRGTAGDPQELGDERVRHLVVDGVAGALSGDDLVAFEHGEVLGEERRLDPVAPGAAHRHRGALGAENLEDRIRAGCASALKRFALISYRGWAAPANGVRGTMAAWGLEGLSEFSIQSRVSRPDDQLRDAGPGSPAR